MRIIAHTISLVSVSNRLSVSPFDLVRRKACWLIFVDWEGYNSSELQNRVVIEVTFANQAI